MMYSMYSYDETEEGGGGGKGGGRDDTTQNTELRGGVAIDLGLGVR